MGHVLLAGPRIENFALVDTTVRMLQRRGVRVSVLATDRVTARFLLEHGISHKLLEPSRGKTRGEFDLASLGERDLRLSGQRPAARSLRRATEVLARRATPLLRVFESDLPDVLLAIEARSGLDRLIQRTAESFGCATAHLGQGLIPGTLQRDRLGVDGDRSTPGEPGDAADRALIDSAVAVALAGAPPSVGTSSRVVFAPSWLDRLRLVLRAGDNGGRARARDRLQAWAKAVDVPEPLPPSAFRELPVTSFVALLLQREDDLQLRLDVDGPVPHPRELLAATRRAAEELGLADSILVVLDDRDTHRAAFESIPGVRVAPHRAAANVAALGVATVTVNHPAACAGALLGTPTFCLGRAMYARPGLARRVALDDLSAAMQVGTAERPGSLSHRAATTLLRDEHVWCDAQRPDPNGMSGLIVWIEGLLSAASPPPPTVHYEPGPDWPTRSDGRAD